MSSSLHSCHWDWCRFTTVSHDDFVQHVIAVHIDKAEPVRREDISLIRHVQQGTSSHSGISSFAAMSPQSEAPQSVSQSGPSTANYPVIRKPEKSRAINHPRMFASRSTNIFPFSQREQQTTVSGSMYRQGESQDISQFEPQTQAAYRSQSFE
ncbi:hypothetical protein BC827DRAFT_645472 [Russula dissimulans]|nr:hypothetical protein BC827DRAFT_645472 [Russula dissimulans]